jgi:hypothetical protein
MMFAMVFVLAGLMGYAPGEAEEPEEEASGSTVVVGTFDSRALAMAYYKSEAHAQYVKDLKAQHEKAKAAGDEDRVKELSAEGEASQELAHKQGFSTWPVDDILEKIKGKIPEIAEQAGVDIIVSKWDIVHKRADVEFIDVTVLMVQPFNPDEETLKLIEEELPKHDPVPLEELKTHEH